MVNEINNQTFNNLINFLLKKWKLFLIVGIVGAIAGIIFSTKEKPSYQSKLIFILDQGGSPLAAELGIAAQLGISIGNDNSAFMDDNIIQIIKSRNVIESVLLSSDTFENKPCTLAEYLRESEFNNEKNNVSFPIGIQKANFNYQQDSILFAIVQKIQSKYLQVSRPDILLLIYEIDFTSPNEKFSKVFTDRLIEEANKLYIESMAQRKEQSIDVLEQRITELQNNIGTSLSNKSSAADANINPAFAAAQTPLIKEQTNLQAYGEAYKEMFKTLEITRYQYLQKLPLIQVIDAPNYPLKKIKTTKLAMAVWFAYIAQFALLLFLIGFKVISYMRKLYL